ncbi:MAG: penicillin-binding transpeptidase domain-containing protein [Acidimicrobiales bacterium]
MLDPQTGAVLGLWSNPTFDPNALATHDVDAGRAAYDLLNAAEGKPLLPKAYQEIYPPGSTFKVVTGSTGVEDGSVTPTEPVYPTIRALDVPGTSRDLPNFGGSACGGTLFTILAKSCNTSFAQMGLDLGGEKMTAGAQAFGFNEPTPFDLATATSRFPTDFTDDQPKLAQSSIGQNDVAATPCRWRSSRR